MNTKRHADLWILDIDGTLMPSHEIDNCCYWRAVDECIGGAAEPQDLGQFRQVTDQGILDEWLQKTGRPALTQVQIKQVRTRFLELIQRAWQEQPHHFVATPGLTDWLDQTSLDPGQQVAIATGGWGHTARFKLQASGLDAYDLPLADCDDAVARTDIMQLARSRLLQKSPPGSETLTSCYVGDGVWDYLASKQLGWDFVGIAEGSRADALRSAGASQVYCNFSEWQASKYSHPTTRNHQGNAFA